MSALVAELGHPVHAALASVEETVAEVASFNPVFLTAADKAAALTALTRIISQVEAVRMQVLAVAGDLAERDGARDPGAWLSAHAHLDPKAAHALWKLASEITHREALAAAMVEGSISVDHARVITHIIDELPADLPATTLAAAQERLITEAARFRPTELRRLGRRILDLIAPDIAAEAEARRLLALEAEAEKKTRLTITPAGDGTTRLHATIPDHAGTRLRTLLQAYAQPRIRALQADGRALPRPRILGQAFTQILETLDPHRLPLHGGDATTLIVTIPLTQLRTQLGTATLESPDGTAGTGSTGDTEATGLSASQARRLACTATIIPAVLGGVNRPGESGELIRWKDHSHGTTLEVHPGAA